jgi:hypothetical protein
LVQFQLHVFSSGFRWRQNVEQPKFDLIWFVEVTSCRTEQAVCAGIIIALLMKPENDAYMQVTRTLRMLKGTALIQVADHQDCKEVREVFGGTISIGLQEHG